MKWQADAGFFARIWGTAVMGPDVFAPHLTIVISFVSFRHSWLIVSFSAHRHMGTVCFYSI